MYIYFFRYTYYVCMCSETMRLFLKYVMYDYLSGVWVCFNGILVLM